MRAIEPAPNETGAIDELVRRTAQLYQDAKRIVDARRSQKASPASRQAESLIERLQSEVAALKAELCSSERRAAEAEARADLIERKLEIRSRAMDPFGGGSPTAPSPLSHVGLANHPNVNSSSVSPSAMDVGSATSAACQLQHPADRQCVESQLPADARIAAAEARAELAERLLSQTLSSIRYSNPSAGVTPLRQRDVCARDSSPVVMASDDEHVPSPTPKCAKSRQSDSGKEAILEAQQAFQAQLDEQCELLWRWQNQIHESVGALQTETSNWREQQAQFLQEKEAWEAERAEWYAKHAVSADQDLERAHARAEALIRDASKVSPSAAFCSTPSEAARSPSTMLCSSAQLATPRVGAHHASPHGYAEQLAAGRNAIASRRRDKLRSMVEPALTETLTSPAFQGKRTGGDAVGNDSGRGSATY